MTSHQEPNSDHSIWSAFGCLLVGTIFETTAVVISFQHAKKLTAENFSQVIESLFFWATLISNLSISIIPTRKDIPVCGFVEGLFDSVTVIIWSFFLISRSFNDPYSYKDEIKRISRSIVQLSLFLSMFFSLLLIFGENALSTKKHVCFFEEKWTHMLLFLIHGKLTFDELRKILFKRQTNTPKMVRVIDEEDLDSSCFTSDIYFMIIGVIVSFASFLIMLLTQGGLYVGGVGFWEIWILLKGPISLKREIKRIQIENDF